MAKRMRSWENEHERQTKVLVNEKLMQQNNAAYMGQIYEKTNTMLFEGAQRFHQESSEAGTSPIVEDENDLAAEMDVEMNEPFALFTPGLPKKVKSLDRAPSPYPSPKELDFFNNFHKNRSHSTGSSINKKYSQIRLERFLNNDLHNDLSRMVQISSVPDVVPVPNRAKQ